MKKYGNMQKGALGAIAVMASFCAYYSCGTKGDEKTAVNEIVVHDTIYKDTVYVAVRDTVFIDAKWLRRRFETAGKTYWKNYGDGYVVGYPDFMNWKILNQGERNLRLEYHDISMVVRAYDDKREMSVKEKYEGMNISANTKSVADSSFLLAGKCDKERCFFEKDIKLKGRTWMYIRVEFPQELTWAVDPLLHEVKDYWPHETMYVTK